MAAPVRVCDLSPAGQVLVSVMGVVVNVSGDASVDEGESLEKLHESLEGRRRGLMVYTVDDGAGTVAVLHWPLRISREECVHVETVRASSSRLRRIASATRAAVVREMCGFKIGTCVEAVGRCELGNRQEVVVYANRVREVTNPNHEVRRIASFDS